MATVQSISNQSPMKAASMTELRKKNETTENGINKIANDPDFKLGRKVENEKKTAGAVNAAAGVSLEISAKGINALTNEKNSVKKTTVSGPDTNTALTEKTTKTLENRSRLTSLESNATKVQMNKGMDIRAVATKMKSNEVANLKESQANAQLENNAAAAIQNTGNQSPQQIYKMMK